MTRQEYIDKAYALLNRCQNQPTGIQLNDLAAIIIICTEAIVEALDRVDGVQR